MPRMWNFWVCLFVSFFYPALFFLFGFLWPLLYMSCILSLLVNIPLFIDKKKKKNPDCIRIQWFEENLTVWSLDLVNNEY